MSKGFAYASRSAAMSQLGKPLTRDDWLAAACKVFVASGIDDVKVDRLARKMKISRGSFYWHFKSRKDLLDGVLLQWTERNRQEMDEIRARWAEHGPDMSDVASTWIGEDPTFPAFDMAIRVWARKAPAVAQAVRLTDDAWIALLKSLFLHNGCGEMEALARARMVYFHQIGYYALGFNEDIEDRLQMAPYYTAVLLGRPPGPSLDRVLDEVRERTAGKAKRQR